MCRKWCQCRLWLREPVTDLFTAGSGWGRDLRHLDQAQHSELLCDWVNQPLPPSDLNQSLQPGEWLLDGRLSACLVETGRGCLVACLLCSLHLSSWVLAGGAGVCLTLGRGPSYAGLLGCNLCLGLLQGQYGNYQQ